MDSKRTGRAFLCEEQAQDPEWWSEEDCAWWSKGKKARKVFHKAMKASRRVVFALTDHFKKGAGKDFIQHKGRGKDQKEKCKEGAYPQSGLSAS